MSVFKNGFGLGHTAYALTGEGWFYWSTGTHTRSDDDAAGFAVIAAGPQFMVERVIGERVLAPVVSPIVVVRTEVEGQDMDSYQLFMSAEALPEARAELLRRLLAHIAVDQPHVAAVAGAELIAQALG